MRPFFTRLLCVDAPLDYSDAAAVTRDADVPLEWAAPALATLVTMAVTLGTGRIIALALGLAP